MTQAAGARSRRTAQFRDFQAMNATDARTAIDDAEFAFMENIIPVGKGLFKIAPAQAATLVSPAAGVLAMFGFILNGNPVLICAGNDGSLYQVNLPGGSVTTIAGANTVTSAVHMSIWQGARIVIVDPTKGYMTWNGTLFTLEDATKVGTTIAVFSGRVWIANNRTVLFTAANTYNNFAADGGNFIMTDEAFPGNISDLHSAFEQLWIVGAGAVNAVANVQVIAGIASFSNTNIISGLGSPNRLSVISFLRALAFMATVGSYVLVGVTPQKLSAKLDGLFPLFTLTPDTPSALANVYQLLLLCFLVTYQDPVAGNRPVLVCFSGGKAFLASQGAGLSKLTSLNASGTWQAWGSDGVGIWRVFGAAASAPTKYTLQSKLYDFGKMMTTKESFRIVLEVATGGVSIAPTFNIENELGPTQVTLTVGTLVTWVNTALAVVTWQNTALATVTWSTFAAPVAQNLSKLAQFGNYLGWTLTGTDPPYQISGWAIEVEERREWSTLKT